VDDDPQVRRFLAAEIPLARWAAPEEITQAALLLTGPQSSYLTRYRGCHRAEPASLSRSPLAGPGPARARCRATP
jgi:hypothetical protein